jgi:hypothetical protein
MGANGWCFFNREKREKRERGPRVGANAREYGVSGWSKTACRLRVGLSVGLSGWFKWVLRAGILRPFRACISLVASCSSHRTRRSGATRMRPAEPGGERGASSSSSPGTADPAGTAGTAGGWRPLPTAMRYYWPEQVVDAASPPRLTSHAAGMPRLPDAPFTLFDHTTGSYDQHKSKIPAPFLASLASWRFNLTAEAGHPTGAPPPHHAVRRMTIPRLPCRRRAATPRSARRRRRRRRPARRGSRRA